MGVLVSADTMETAIYNLLQFIRFVDYLKFIYLVLRMNVLYFGQQSAL